MAHGVASIDVVAPRSKFYHGPFGRLCPDLPAADVGLTDDELHAFASTQMIEHPGKTPGEIADDRDLTSDLEDAFGSNIPAGYTYFGQFVDHDITFDPASKLMRQNDPNALLNHRTPRLDLDNVYGRGPADQPYLYDPNDSAKFAIGHVEGRLDLPDLPRYGARKPDGTLQNPNQAVALIGDKRNDENAIISQLQLAFLMAHNRLVGRARVLHPTIKNDDAFEMARKTLRWLYQHIVWNDFIPRITNDEIYKCALSLEKACGGRSTWIAGFEDIYNWKNQPFMPVEFSVAAYRFGHSMVRNAYRTNFPERGFNDPDSFAPIFDNTAGTNGDDLRGFRPMTAKNSIQWDWFLPMNTSQGPFPQMARKIDTKLSNALGALHEAPVGDRKNVLAFLNLKRGTSFALPSGADIARKWCLKPLQLRPDEPNALWYYILREAQGIGGNGLGRVGSTIVCSVFAGLLKGDPSSWFNQAPCWTPDDDPLLSGTDFNQDDPNWTLASVIRLAGLNSDGIGLA